MSRGPARIASKIARQSSCSGSEMASSASERAGYLLTARAVNVVSFAVLPRGVRQSARECWRALWSALGVRQSVEGAAVLGALDRREHGARQARRRGARLGLEEQRSGVSEVCWRSWQSRNCVGDGGEISWVSLRRLGGVLALTSSGASKKKACHCANHASPSGIGTS